MLLTFNHQTHKMVKETQKICRQKPTNSLSVLDDFMRLALNPLSANVLIYLDAFQEYGESVTEY